MSGFETALLAAGTGLSVVGALQEADARADYATAQEEAAEYNRAVTDRNIEIARTRRKQQVREAEIAAEDKRRENRRILSRMRAGFGNSGLALTGSTLDVLEDSATELELDAQREEYQGQIGGYESALDILGLESEAQIYDLEADAARSRRRKARLAGLIGAGAAGASGGAKALGTDYAKENWF